MRTSNAAVVPTAIFVSGWRVSSAFMALLVSGSRRDSVEGLLSLVQPGASVHKDSSSGNAYFVFMSVGWVFVYLHEAVSKATDGI